MDSTTASAQIEAYRSGPVFLAAQKAISQHEGRGIHAAQQASSVPGADHFFTDQLEPMQRALAGWLKEPLP
jgi:alpha/beta superfamily hydrolase